MTSALYVCGTENEITSNKDIQELCYEALKDIFPGGGRRVVQRSKAWKIIEASLKVTNRPVQLSLIHLNNIFKPIVVCWKEFVFFKLN